MKKLSIVSIVCIAVLTSYGYGVKGMRRGIRKSSASTYSTSSYSSVNHSYSSINRSHGVNGCVYKGCHGSMCRNSVMPSVNDTKKSSLDVRTTLAIVRTMNQTASTVNRIKTSNEQVAISRDNLEVRKYNAGLDSKFGKKTECVPEIVNTKVEIVDNTSSNDLFYRKQYEEYCRKYDSEKDKTTSLAQFYFKKMNEYGEKIGISSTTRMSL